LSADNSLDSGDGRETSTGAFEIGCKAFSETCVCPLADNMGPEKMPMAEYRHRWNHLIGYVLICITYL
jgi:hypothetical protein